MRLTGSIGSGTDCGRATTSALAWCKTVLLKGLVAPDGGDCAREFVTSSHPSATVRSMRPKRKWFIVFRNHSLLWRVSGYAPAHLLSHYLPPPNRAFRKSCALHGVVYLLILLVAEPGPFKA